ncbi:MAG: hypothetical protein AUK47_14930 [Deltaproteobacteria bacterium CG2_30_63_29]|nr:MAG: hypothetical protein AUK47_14930 [Deltaproteobacteria bacterium CG2_30_63_29]PJB43055.1 MAG: DUF58 domain-containing protein [Deltaproteobacteria bacterium CG_4_9_14_3_um_filter_63_12]
MLTSEIIKQVKQIQIRTGRQVADVLAGEYLSVFKGRGMEFDEVRPYVPGDDVRTIDWNVTARMGLPYVKRYVEERELTVILLVDVSASQDFGSGRRSKREVATELSALLAFSAIQNDDKIGLLLFHGGAEEYIPARKGQKHALRVVREVLARGTELAPEPADTSLWRLPKLILQRFTRLKELTRREPRRSTSIAFALQFCQKVIRRRAVIFLISDFIDEDYLQLLRSTNGRHDVVAIHISDQRERVCEDAGLLTLEDAESGVARVIDTSSVAFRETVKRESEARLEGLEKELASSGIDLIRIDADGSIAEPLISFFRARQRRIRR